ncbi:FUSC family protein [Luteimonas sp. MJ250]|uniref:FUSC family protein n=1 Tax=Luteimonas sp. MJ250 TaxID=3129236 RepID=UPI0031B9BAE1
MALQFVVEMLVVRNYALAVVFITSAALLLASGGQLIEAPGPFVLARGVDTAIGCAIALLVFRLLPARPAAARTTPGPLGAQPPLLERELRSLQECLAREPGADAGLTRSADRGPVSVSY